MKKLFRIAPSVGLESDDVVLTEAPAAAAAAASDAPAEVVVDPAEPAVAPTEVVATTDEPAAATDNPDAEINALAAELPVGTEVEVKSDEIVIKGSDLTVIDEAGAEGDAAAAEGDEFAEAADTLLDETADAEDAVVALEAIATHIRSGMGKRGGLSGRELKLARISNDYIRKSLNLDQGLGFLSLESVTDTEGLRQTAELALEEIGTTAATVWEAIQKAVLQAFEWLKKFAANTFTALGRLDARAKKLDAVSKTLTGKTPTTKEVGSAGLVKALATGGKVDAASLPAKLQGLIAFNNVATGPAADSSFGEIVSVFNEIVKNDGQGAEKLVSVVQGLTTKGMKKDGVDAKMYGLDDAPAGTALFTSPVFLGNSVVYAHVPQSGDAINNLRTGAAAAQVEIADTAKAPVLSPNQINTIAKLAQVFVQQKKQYEKINVGVGQLVSSIAKAAAGAASVGDAKAGGKAVINAVKGARALIKGLHQPSFALTTAKVNAALEYAALSVKAYGAVADVKAVEPAPAAA